MNISQVISFYKTYIGPAADILIIAYLVYQMYRLLTKTQAMQLARGTILLALIWVVAYVMQLSTLLWILNLLAPGIVIALAIIFQPELRKVFIRLGQGAIFRKGSQQKTTKFDVILNAAEILARKKRGALIVFQRFINLNDVIDKGTRIDALISSSLLLTIFEYNTSMHDGAVVIKGDRLLAAGCFLPVSEQQDIKRSFGSRHRAALGLSETSDAVVLVVSEETGALSLAYESKLYYNLTVPAVKKRLMQLIEDKELTEPDEEFHEAE